MKLFLNTHKMNEPTSETFGIYISQKFKKIGRFMSRTHLDSETAETKVNAEFIHKKKTFKIKAALTVGSKTYVISIEDKDFRRAIDIIVDNLRLQLIESRGKNWLNYH